jgi:hypothetical protein
MKINVARSAALLLMAFLAASVSQLARPQAKDQSSRQAPSLMYTCLITSDVKQLTDFYQRVLQIKPHVAGDSYVEFRAVPEPLRSSTPVRRKSTFQGQRSPDKTRAQFWNST